MEIVLRPLRDEDVPAIVDACNDVDSQRWTVGLPSPYTADDAREFLESACRWNEAGERIVRAIADAETGAWLGTIDVRLGEHASVGYLVAPQARGRGVATRALVEASRAAIRTHGVERLELTTHPENVASQRVAEKAGFVREGVLRAYLKRLDGSRRDAVVFSLLPTDL